MADRKDSNERKNPGRRSRRGSESTDETIVAPAARRPVPVRAILDRQVPPPAYPPSNPASPAPGGFAERRVTAVVDLTDDDGNDDHHVIMNPLLRHLFTLPLIMGSLFDGPFGRPRTPDQRDHSSLMEIYGGGYWKRRREESTRKEDASKAAGDATKPTKIRLTQRERETSSANDSTAGLASVTRAPGFNGRSPLGTTPNIVQNGRTASGESSDRPRPVVSSYISIRIPAAQISATLGPGQSDSHEVTHAHGTRTARTRGRHPSSTRTHPPSTTTDLPTSQIPLQTSQTTSAQRHATEAGDDDDIQVVSVSESTSSLTSSSHLSRPTRSSTTPQPEPIEISDESETAASSKTHNNEHIRSNGTLNGGLFDSTADNKDSQTEIDNEENRKTAAAASAPAHSIFKDYKCVVCLDGVTDATATFCGHIFCEGCILHAIESNHRCPTCRCKLSEKEIHPLFV